MDQTWPLSPCIQICGKGTVQNRCICTVLKKWVHVFWAEVSPQSYTGIIKCHAIEKLIVSSIPRRALHGVETLNVILIVHLRLTVHMLSIDTEAQSAESVRQSC